MPGFTQGKRKAPQLYNKFAGNNTQDRKRKGKLKKEAYKMESALFGLGCVLGGMFLGSFITFCVMCFIFAIGEEHES